MTEAKEDRALSLWKEWFDYNGIPWERDADNWDSSCFFCGKGHPEHEGNCVFIRAKKLIEEKGRNVRN